MENFYAFNLKGIHHCIYSHVLAINCLMMSSVFPPQQDAQFAISINNYMTSMRVWTLVPFIDGVN